MAHAFAVGAVLHWEMFDNNRPQGAEIKNKFLLVLGAKPGNDVLMVLATTQKHYMKLNPGCRAKEGYYFILGVAKEFFPKDTWLLLAELKVANAAMLIDGGMKGTIRVCGNLRDELVRAIINCLKKTNDVSEYHLSLL